jgi:REP element-mobilizing transposase RayT
MYIRKNIRLQHYDYSSNGAYFVTICTSFRQKIITDGERSIIENELKAFSQKYKGVLLDYYTIVQDHLHFIVVFYDSSISLPRLVQAFKSFTTMQLKKAGFNGKFFWQKNYYEHVIRSENALNKIRQYIINNPDAVLLKKELMRDN